MGLLIFIVLVVLVFAMLSNRKSSTNATATPPTSWIEQHNAQWIGFIVGYRELAKSKAEKQFVRRMLQDLAAQGYVVPAEGQPMLAETVAQPAETVPQEQAVAEVSHHERNVQLDNASMLLYFGAFLFVASVGLFVAFGGFPGTVRTFAVGLVAAVMYLSGIWIFRNKPKLEQAGLAFASIGLATAPFVGLAAYNFVFNRSAGTWVWFGTSVVCLGLYLHALFTLRKPLLNYILIFTFLSLIESQMATFSAPIYYFGWGLSAVGILLAVFGRHKGFDQAFRDASNNSAQAFLPLAIVASLLMLDTQGVGQLGVSLLLATAFYAAEFVYGRSSTKVGNAVASQAAAILAVGTLAYAVKPEFWVMGAALAAFTVAQALAVYVRATRGEVWLNFGSILMVGGIAAAFASVERPGMLLISLLALVLSSAIVWLKQVRTEAYSLVVVAWTALPIVIGQLCLHPHLTIAGQAALSLAALLVQWAVLVIWRRPHEENWQFAAKVLYLLSSVSVLGLALAASPSTALLVAASVAVSMAVLAERYRDTVWASAAGIVIALPVLWNIDQRGWFAAVTALALASNIVVALRYRPELNRWVGSALWLLLPASLGTGLFGHWTAAQYGWAYMAVLAGFVFARAIARGVIFVSGRVPLASYEKSASLSYVVGYCLSGAIAVVTSGFSGHSQLHTSLVLAVLGLVIWLLADKIERQYEALSLLPLVAQAVLLSAVRPDANAHAFDFYLLASTALALCGFVAMAAMRSLSGSQSIKANSLRDGSLIAAGVAPATVLYVGHTHLMMPIGLLVFAALLYYRERNAKQEGREWIGGLGLAGIWWVMSFAGVHNVQAYSHTLALLFALYAFWRHVRKEIGVSDKYILAMLVTATVPLILQALGGTSGDLYGWWLLLEQVFFMLLGMTLGKGFVTRWGLYVAVGAVLYQLRHLGWAALTVLALFLIGLAVYRLQKIEKK